MQHSTFVEDIWEPLLANADLPYRGAGADGARFDRGDGLLVLMLKLRGSLTMLAPHPM